MKQHLTPQQWLRVDAVWQRLLLDVITDKLAGGKQRYYIGAAHEYAFGIPWGIAGIANRRIAYEGLFEGTGWHANTANGDIVFRIV